MRRQVATLFSLGHLGPAPGTCGSLIALPLALALHTLAGPIAVAIGAAALFLLGLWAVAAVADDRRPDPPEVVIDEVAGQLTALYPVSLMRPALADEPFALPTAALAAFLLFRLFDIAKPGPIGWADRRLSGPVGIMLDDLLAGLASAVLVATGIALLAA